MWRCEQLRLTIKTGKPLRVMGERAGKNLERNLALQLQIARLVHFAHPACADLAGD